MQLIRATARPARALTQPTLAPTARRSATTALRLVPPPSERARPLSCQRAELVARHTLITIRVLMGTLLVVCGLDAIFHFLPHSDASMPGHANALGGALILAGAAFPLLKGVEVIVATLLDSWSERQVEPNA